MRSETRRAAALARATPTAEQRDEIVALLEAPPSIVRVPAEFEAAYAARRKQDTEQNLRLAVPITAPFVLGLGGATWAIAGLASTSRDALRFGVVLVIELVIVLFATIVLPRPRVLEYFRSLTVVGGSLAAAATTVGAATSDSPKLAEVSTYLTILILTIVMIVFRIGFRLSVLTCVLGGVLSALVASVLGGRPDWPTLAFAYVSASGVGIVLAFILERQQILQFLQTLVLSYEVEERARLNRELENMSRTDSLSGLANRRSFDDTLDREWARMISDRTSLALVFVDVDHFKRFNDTYGHRRGDECLRAIGRALAACANRPADLAARYGGEEFVLLLPNTDAAGATVIAERVRTAVSDLRIAHADSPTAEHVTVSVGFCAAMGPTERETRHFVDSADSALYRAKNEGRNRVCSSELRGDSLRPVGHRHSDGVGKS